MNDNFFAHLSSDISYLRQKIDSVESATHAIALRLEKLESEITEAKPLISRYKSYANVVKDTLLLATFLYTIYTVVKG